MRLCGFKKRWNRCGGVAPFRGAGVRIWTTLSMVIDSDLSRGMRGGVAVIRK